MSVHPQKQVGCLNGWTENAGPENGGPKKMRHKNAGPDNEGPQKQDRKMEDKCN